MKRKNKQYALLAVLTRGILFVSTKASMHATKKYFSRYFPSIAAVVVLLLLTGSAVRFAPKNSSLATPIAHAGTVNITGWAWSDYIGWVSFAGNASDGSPYGVTVNTVTGALGGYAWNDGIGWINFNSNTCGAQATLTNGALSGWAQATSNGGSWDGCIKLSDSAAPAFGVTLSGTTFTGYAWGSDIVGWLSFSGTASDGSPYSVVYGGSTSPTCTLSASPNPTANGTSINLNYTTTNNPSTGTIKDPSNATITTAATNSSGAFAATAPASAGTYAYNMTVSSPSGTNSCAASLTTKVDLCTDIAGLQNPYPAYPCVPPNPSPGACLQTGVTWNGTQCVITGPFINSFTGPTRVRAGASNITLTYTISNVVGTCDITGTNGYDSGAFTPGNGTQGQVTVSNPIASNTGFNLDCGGVSKSINVGITPTYKEQ